VALASTCRRMHDIWVQNSPNIIWHVAPKVVPAFDRALMTVSPSGNSNRSESDGYSSLLLGSCHSTRA
jgi:hypothetical protein